MSNSFSEAFRPQTPKQLIGETQKRVAQVLLDNVANGKVVRELLLTGESGVGKTTIARMYIRAVLGLSFEENLKNYIVTVNCSDKTGIDDMRKIVIENMAYLPMMGAYKVYFLDEVHRMSSPAQDAMLTEIEPVPSHVIIIASTTNPSKLVPTFRSRFDEHYLGIPTTKDFQWLAWAICKKLGRELDNNTRDEIIAISNGNVRQFVRYVQQALDGSFSINSLEETPGIELVKLILGGDTNLTRWFGAVSDSTDFVQQATGMAGYAIAVLKNPSSNPNAQRSARAVLEFMGDAPARTIDSKYTFFNRLLAVHGRLTNGTHS